MGAYVNPPGEAKEAWLLREGKLLPVAKIPDWDLVPSDLLIVCLVTNPDFTAAGICFDEKELIRFSDPRDERSKIWFLVDTEKLLNVSSELEGHLIGALH